MLFKLPIMLLSISPKIYIPIMLNIMLHYAKLCSINCKKLPMFSATPTYNYSNLLLSEYLISYSAN